MLPGFLVPAPIATEAREVPRLAARIQDNVIWEIIVVVVVVLFVVFAMLALFAKLALLALFGCFLFESL